MVRWPTGAAVRGRRLTSPTVISATAALRAGDPCTAWVFAEPHDPIRSTFTASTALRLPGSDHDSCTLTSWNSAGDARLCADNRRGVVVYHVAQQQCDRLTWSSDHREAVACVQFRGEVRAAAPRIGATVPLVVATDTRGAVRTQQLLCGASRGLRAFDLRVSNTPIYAMRQVRIPRDMHWLRQRDALVLVAGDTGQGQVTNQQLVMLDLRMRRPAYSASTATQSACVHLDVDADGEMAVADEEKGAMCMWRLRDLSLLGPLRRTVQPLPRAEAPRSLFAGRLSSTCSRLPPLVVAYYDHALHMIAPRP